MRTTYDLGQWSLGKIQFNSAKIAYSIYPKPHAHIMMTHVSVRAGIKKFGQKGNDMLLKE